MSRWEIFKWLLAPGAGAVAAASAVQCWRHRRRIFFTFGIAGAALATYVVLAARHPNTESWEDLMLVAMWMFFVMPLAGVALVGALLPTRTAPANDPAAERRLDDQVAATNGP